jgi:hypothetical protein
LPEGEAALLSRIAAGIASLSARSNVPAAIQQLHPTPRPSLGSLKRERVFKHRLDEGSRKEIPHINFRSRLKILARGAA